MTDLARAREIADRKPRPGTWAEELARAEEVIAAVGDLPEPLAYDMLMRAPHDVPDPLADIHRLRGPNAPAYEPTGRI